MAVDVIGSPAWIEAGSFWVALVGLLFGLGALIVSIMLGVRSARAAEDSALHARASAEAAVAATRAEQERYHEDHYPDENGTLTFHAATTDPATTELHRQATGGQRRLPLDPAHRPILASATDGRPSRTMELPMWPARYSG